MQGAIFRRLIVLPVLMLGALVFASAAQAAFGVNGLVATPVSTDAGAHSQFHVHLDVTSPADGLRDLMIGLPPGLSGNPQSVPKCTGTQFNADNCPAASQVGTTVNNITAGGVLPLDVQGGVYNLVPQAGEPARLGIILRPSAGDKIFSQVKVNLRPDFGLDTVLTDLPNKATLGGFPFSPISINSVDLKLDGTFMSNPTSCGEQVTNFAVRSWAMGADDPSATGSASFTTTNCDKQPYAPKASLDINGLGKKLVTGSRPEVTSMITQADGEANSKRAEVILPSGLAIDVSHLNFTCPPADFVAGTCAENTHVGNAVAQTPLLSAPLSGPVYLLTGATGLPGIGIELNGELNLKLQGSSGLGEDNRNITILDGLPDLPLSDFKLTFPGGTGSLLVVTGKVCAASAKLNANFTSQAGQKVGRSVATGKRGCPGGSGGAAKRPKAKVKVVGAKRHRPGFSVRVRAGSVKIKGVRVKLPSLLRLRPAKAKRAVVIRANGHRVAKRKLRVKKGLLEVRALPGKGARVVSIKVRPIAIKASPKLHKGRKLTFKVFVAQRGAHTARLAVRTRAH